MKRACVWLILVCMLSAGLPAAMAEEWLADYAPLDMCCVDKGTFAFAAQDEILVVKGGNAAAQVECEDVEYIDYLDGTLYALCTREDGAHIAAFGGDLLEKERYELGWLGQINGFAVNADYIAVAAMNTATYEDELYFYDLETREVIKKEEYMHAGTPAADDDRILFRCHDGLTEVIAIFFPEDGYTGIAAENPTYGELFAVPDQDVCINLTSDAIEYISWSDGETQKRSYHVTGLGQMSALADVDGEKVYIYDEQSDRMLEYAFDKLAGVTNNTLTIAALDDSSFGSFLKLGAAYFQKVYPNYTVEYKTYADMDKMRLDLMSAESDVDVLVSYTGYYSQIVSSGVFADLRYFACIRALEESGEFVQWPFHFVESADGELLMLPIGSSAEPWHANVELFERLGLKLPEEGWTWDDLLALGRQAKKIDPNVYLIHHPATLLNQYSAEYIDLIGGEVRYDTPLFRHVLEIYKAMLDEELAWVTAEDGEPVEALFDTYSSLDQQVAIKEGTMFMPSLQKGDKPVCSVQASLVGVYSASDDMEMAAELISLMYRAPLDKEAPVVGAQTEYPLFYADTTVNRRSAETAKNGTIYCLSAEHALQMRNFCEYASPMQPFNAMTDEIHSVAYLEYAAGKIGIEDTVRRIQRNVERVICE